MGCEGMSVRKRKGVGGQQAINTTQPKSNTSVVMMVPHHAPHPLVAVPLVCPVCGR